MIDAIIIKFVIYLFIYESIKEKRIERERQRVYSIYTLKRFTVNIENKFIKKQFSKRIKLQNSIKFHILKTRIE